MLVQLYKKGNSVPFIFYLFKSFRSFESIFYKQLPWFQKCFKNLVSFHFLAIAIFKHTLVHLENFSCSTFSQFSSHAVLCFRTKASSGTDDSSKEISAIKTVPSRSGFFRKSLLMFVFIYFNFFNTGSFSDIILSLLLPDGVRFLKTLPYISVAKRRPSLGPSLLNRKPVNI